MTSMTIAWEAGERTKTTLVLVPALGTSPTVWEKVVAQLSERFHCVALALPGHRGSTGTARADESIAQLASDVIEIAREQQWGDFIVAGVSIGGAVALEVGLANPEGLAGIGVVCAAGRFGTEQAWRERAATVEAAGTGALIDFATKRWFAEGFAEKDGESVGTIMNDLLHCDDASYVALCNALAVWDRRQDVAGIEVPSIVISGELDPATTPAEGAALSEVMEHSRFVTIPDVSHLAPVEAPETVAELLKVLARHIRSGRDDSRVRGFRTRREVLGDAHVDAAQARSTPETAVFQDFITRYAWGDVWSREQLDRRSRSIATLAALVAIGNEHELAMHIRAARRHGLSVEEIGEVFLHVGIYAGVPHSNAAFGVLRAVLAEDSHKAND